MKKPIIAVISALAGAAAGAGIVIGRTSKKIKNENDYGNKHLALYLMMNQWVKIKQENKSIAEYLENQGYRTIAIYGMNYVGETLLNELAGSDIEVKYAIDKNAAIIYSDVDVITPDDELEAVDAVVVTPITFFDEIEQVLGNKTDAPVISLKDILDLI
ncbi:MAG: hypothetical protein K2M91_00680 [Lachnospiraceae bacterium]|nr:hypothetical protein [Lachnospiraceae bacterium]